jgi:2-C-methyl-D-erythritol 2,4-cyclodiphosphate synthase
MFSIRTGIGFDVHQLAQNHELWLGGILIPHTMGAVGHSDADVLIHAICDALLGAAGLRDIGWHFPDTSARFKNIDSKLLLAEVMRLVREKNWEIGNIDTVIVLQKPKISGFIPSMQSTLANVLQVDAETVSIKATTTEHLGYEGREEGISAFATVLIFKKKQ